MGSIDVNGRCQGRCNPASPRWGLAAVLVLLAGVAGANDIQSREVVVVVAAESPLEAISRNALADLYLGRTGRFPDDRPAIPLDLVEGSAIRSEFYDIYLGRSTAQMKAHWSKIIFTGRGSPPREAASGLEMRRLVALDPRVIGYLDRSQVDSSVKILRIE